MTDIDPIAAAVRRLLSTYTGSEPTALHDYIANPSQFRVRASGTTVPLLARPLRTTSSGLLVPEPSETNVSEAIEVYATPEEALGLELPVAWVLDQIASINVLAIVKFTATWMAKLANPANTTSEVERQYVDQLEFRPEPLRRVRALSEAGRRFVVPQALMLMTKLGILMGNSPSSEVGDTRALPMIQLALCNFLGPQLHDEETQEGQDALYAELIANQHLNAQADVGPQLATFVRRWVELPPEHADQPWCVDIAQLFEASTGFTLKDLAIVAGATWASTNSDDGSPFITTDALTTGRVREGTALAVLNHLSLSIEDMRERLLRAEGGASSDVSPWEFSELTRHPLLRHDGTYAILNPAWLIERAFGWLPFFDIEWSLRHDDLQRGRFNYCIRKITEIYAGEVVRAIAPKPIDGVTCTVFDEDALRLTYPKGKIADFAVDYGATWVLFEISTRRLSRRAVRAESLDDAKADIEVLIGKAKQLHSTIQKIRDGESRLVGRRDGPRNFCPIVVTTEGFPINPASMYLIRKRLSDEGLLQESDVSPLEVIDLQTLNYIEAVQASGGPPLDLVLSAKARSGEANISLHHYMHFRLRLSAPMSNRLRHHADKAFEWMRDSLQPLPESPLP